MKPNVLCLFCSHPNPHGVPCRREGKCEVAYARTNQSKAIQVRRKALIAFCTACSYGGIPCSEYDFRSLVELSEVPRPEIAEFMEVTESTVDRWMDASRSSASQQENVKCVRFLLDRINQAPELGRPHNVKDLKL